MQSTYDKPPRKNEKYTQKWVTGPGGISGPDHPPARSYGNEVRAQQIRELPAADLAAFCYPAELPGELSRRAYWGQMDQTNLEFHATYDPDAAAEVKRRLGELPR